MQRRSALGHASIDGAVPSLRALARDGSRASGLRAAAARSLGRLRSPILIEALDGLLDDRDPAVRRAAVEAYGRLAPAAALVQRLGRHASSDRDPATRHEAMLAIAERGGDGAVGCLRALEHRGRGSDLDFARIALGLRARRGVAPDVRAAIERRLRAGLDDGACPRRAASAIARRMT